MSMGLVLPMKLRRASDRLEQARHPDFDYGCKMVPPGGAQASRRAGSGHISRKSCCPLILP